MSKCRIDITSPSAYSSPMPRIPFTLRLEPAERTALNHLSEIEGRPINQLLSDAVKLYLQQRTPKQRNLEENFQRLREYRKKDPDFKLADAAFVEPEVKIKDPLEGEVFEAKRVNGKLEPLGPAQRKMRELLGA